MSYLYKMCVYVIQYENSSGNDVSALAEITYTCGAKLYFLNIQLGWQKSILKEGIGMKWSVTTVDLNHSPWKNELHKPKNISGNLKYFNSISLYHAQNL